MILQVTINIDECTFPILNETVARFAVLDLEKTHSVIITVPLLKFFVCVSSISSLQDLLFCFEVLN